MLDVIWGVTIGAIFLLYVFDLKREKEEEKENEMKASFILDLINHYSQLEVKKNQIYIKQHLIFIL
jgi:hypothetical protein